MESLLSLEDVRRALEAQDPDVVRLVVDLSAAPDPEPKGALREGAPTVGRLLTELRSRAFRRKSREEQAHHRTEGIKALEAPGAEVPLPERFRLHEPILELWRRNGPFERQCLLQIIAEAPLKWGPWRALKRIFKEAETRGDTEVHGALCARFDTALGAGKADGEVSLLTLGYLCRRGWRRLRRTARSLPTCYADEAVEVLRFYPEGVNWPGTWIANHIFHHETKKYSRQRFTLGRRPQSLLKDRAYAELWQRTPRPLFTLLERAASEEMRGYAAQALKTDFRSLLREVEPAWVVRLIGVRSASVDQFVIWLLGNVPKFEQGAFRQLGLHAGVLALLDSPAPEAQAYAAAYARTHARDLPLDELVRLANSEHESVQTLARDLLRDRDPRTEVGLEAWGELLGTEHGHELASAALRKHFGARELTPEWFRARLCSARRGVVEFAVEMLPKIHAPKSLGVEFFRSLLDEPELGAAAARFALECLARFEVGELGSEFLKRALLNPECRAVLRSWIEQERIAAAALGAEYWKSLACKPDWEASTWVQELKDSGRPWARKLEWSSGLSKLALELLGDVRKFSPKDLGFEWLLRLVQRSEPEYHEFAVEYMIKAFVPADFVASEPAPGPEAQQPEAAGGAASGQGVSGGASSGPGASDGAANGPGASDGAASGPGVSGGPPSPPVAVDGPPGPPGSVDLGSQSFLFTGTLSTMTRTEAERKVTEAGGANASGVTARLHYLVIGDEGSPLYGHGRKGSKQLKAEQLIAKGAAIKVISETAFLQMLAGEQRSFSEDTVQKGCERLWKMATDTGPADEPLRKFALRYLRRHHTGLGPELSDRPVDPGAEIPPEWLSFERVRPAFTDPRPEIRGLALDLGRWEFARWKPPMEAIVALCEAPHPEVRQFVAKALLADEGREHALYRVDPAALTAEAVYSFVESLDQPTRALGMQLIRRNPRLAEPQEIFRLTESPDRQVRAFMVRTIWSLYRDRGITPHWKPAPPPQTSLGADKKDKKKAEAPGTAGPGGAPQKPTELPASHAALQAFLRQGLYGIPPARLEKSERGPEQQDEAAKKKRLRPLPARKAKLALIEVLRDLALEDGAFAAVVTPLLQEFMATRGQSEHAACLVALTRLGAMRPVAQEAR